MSRVVVVGSGNVASHLARRFMVSDGCELVQVISRNRIQGEVLASSCGLSYSSFEDEIESADYYILALKDDVVEQVAQRLMPLLPSGSVICHTSASLPLIECGRADVSSGRFYPLQTFTKGIEVDFDKITIFIESKCGKSSKNLVALSEMVARQGVESDGSVLKKIHLAATFANNFTNRMYQHANMILESAGVELDVLFPLIEEGVDKLVRTNLSPKELQTGAAARGDLNIIMEHRALLAGDELELYDLITKDILNDKF